MYSSSNYQRYNYIGSLTKSLHLAFMESTRSYDNSNIAFTPSACSSKRRSRLMREIYAGPLLLGVAFACIVGVASGHAQDAGGQDPGALALPEVNVEGANAAGAAVESSANACAGSQGGVDRDESRGFAAQH